MNFTERTLKRGESIFHQKGNLVANIWQDKKLVSIMSTNCQPTGPTTVRRKQKDGQVQSVPCPPNVVAYNKFMGGVDRCDQLRGYYRLRTKSKKFYRYVFWFLFDCCIVNAFTLVKHYCPITVSNRQAVIKDFRQQLALGLIGQYSIPGRGMHCQHPSVKLPATVRPHRSSGELVLLHREVKAISLSKAPLLAVIGAGTIKSIGDTSQQCTAENAGKHSVSFPGTASMGPHALRGTTLRCEDAPLCQDFWDPFYSFAATA